MHIPGKKYADYIAPSNDDAGVADIKKIYIRYGECSKWVKIMFRMMKLRLI